MKYSTVRRLYIRSLSTDVSSNKSVDMIITVLDNVHCESKNCTLFVSNITLSNVDQF